MNLVEWLRLISAFLVPAMVVGIPVYGLFKRVPVYESFVTGAREGFQIAVLIIPYLVAILFAIEMFKASGAMETLQEWLRPVLGWLGFPPEVLPMAIIRPLTGGGSTGLLADMAETYGPNSLVTRMASVMFGSTETTFYVVAVYFGAVNVRKTRHAVPAGLIADITAIFLAVYVIRLLFG